MDPELLQELSEAQIDSLLALPDDELLRAIARLREPAPDTTNVVSRAQKRINQIARAAAPPDDDTGVLGNLFGGALESAALALQGAGTFAVQADNKIFGMDRKVRESFLFNLGANIAGFVEEHFPNDPVEQASFWGDALPRMIGSTVGLIATTPAIGGFVSVGGAASEAEAQGLTSEEIIEKSVTPENLLAGGIEFIPIGRAISGFKRAKRLSDEAAKVFRKTYARRVLTTGALEGTQEVAQGALETQSARRTGLDPDRQFFEGAGTEAAGGFLVGAMMEAALGGMGLKMRNAGVPPQDVADVAARLPSEQGEALLEGYGTEEEVGGFGAGDLLPTPAVTEAQIDERATDETGRASEPLEEERLAEGSEALAEEVADSPAEEALAPEEAAEPAGRAPVESADTVEEASAFTEDVALNKRATARVRQALDLAQLAPAKRRGWDVAITEAQQEGLVSDADVTAREAIANPKLAVTDKQRAAWLLRTAELQTRLKEAIERGNSAVIDGDVNSHRAAVAEVNTLIDRIADIQQASKLTATETARSLAFLGAGLNRELYEQGQVLARAQMSKGKRLTATEQRVLSKQAEGLEAAEGKEARLAGRFEERVEEISRGKAQAAINTMRRKRRATEKTIREREDAKAKLRALGLEVNTGINPEQAAQLARLIRTYVEEGVTRLDEVIRTVRRDIPALEPRDVIDTLAGRLAQKQAERQARKDLLELQKQSRLIAKIEDALGTTRGAPERVRSKVMDSETVGELRGLLAEVNERAAATTREAERLAEIRERLQRVREAIANEEAIPVQRRRPDSPNVQEALRELREARSIMRLEHEQRELREQLRAKVFVIPKKAARREASIELQEARAEVRRLRRQIDTAVEALSPLTARDIVLAAFELPRNLLASGDIGALGRQGFYHTFNPFKVGKTRRAGVAMVKSLLSGQKSDQLQEQIRSGPLYPIMRQARLAIKDLDDLRFVDRETVVRNNLIERLAARKILRGEEVSPALAGLAEYMRASERNMIVALNFLRAELFADFYAKNPALTMAEYKAFAHYINVTTGHGPAFTAGKAGEMSDMLNRFFFSPRLLTSRIFTPFTAARVFRDVPAARKQITQDFGGLLTGAGLVLFLGSLIGELEFDPDDSDFLKIQTGNIRIDPFGGYGQSMRLAARTALLSDGIRELTGNEVPRGRPDDDFYSLWGTFLKYKLAPGLTSAAQFAFGKDPIGRDISKGEALLRSITPIMAQESFDAFKETGSISSALATLLISDIGIGVAVFDDPLKRQGVDNVIQRADYIPQARYPEGATDEEKAQLKRAFRERMAERILPNSEFYMSLQPEDLKERLQEIAQEVR